MFWHNARLPLHHNQIYSDMKANKFNEEFFADVREREVWKLLCGDSNFIWTEALIDRYQDNIDWKRLSGNSGVQWTTSMLEKYRDKIDWETLSGGSNEYLYSVENLRKYSAKWNWSELSSNSSVNWTIEKVEEFKDLLNWDSLINLWRNNEFYTLAFFEKYKDYFPVSSLLNSALWDTIIEIYKNRLIGEILSR
jgi:hypothetical protein